MRTSGNISPAVVCSSLSQAFCTFSSKWRLSSLQTGNLFLSLFFSLYQGCFFCFPSFPFANITGFCCQLLYLLLYHAAFQPTVFTETNLTLEISEEAISHHLKQPPDNCMLKGTSIVCRALLEPSLAARSCTPGIIIVWGVQAPNVPYDSIWYRKKMNFLAQIQ